MLFNSLHFVVFFPVALLLYYITPGRHRWATLLALSYYFYGSWRVEYLFLLAVSTLVDYLAGIYIDRTTVPAARRAYLAVSMVANLSILFVFKYWAFFSETLRFLLSPFGVAPGPSAFHPLLPVGISFFTFQTMAYTIEVYRGRCPPERHLGRFALYISFFPQLVAGPIERPQGLLPQLRSVIPFDASRALSGLTRMAWGFFLKLVIADRLAVAVNSVFNNPEGQSAGTIALATYLFAWQIYADFAGYTDIAIGAARIMGYELMENFRRPFFAKSITDFWRRWHISMSAWFRDYLFTPLGGARKGRVRALLNVSIVFIASGLWHGAAWPYVLSGLMFAVLFLVGHVTRDLRNAAWERAEAAAKIVRTLRPWISTAVTFNIIAVVWLVFRSNSATNAWYFFQRVVTGTGGWKPDLALSKYQLAIALAALLIVLSKHIVEERERVDDILLYKPVLVRWAAFYVIATACLVFGYFQAQPFIYFQF